jgi:hypothetical protein
MSRTSSYLALAALVAVAMLVSGLPVHGQRGEGRQGGGEGGGRGAAAAKLPEAPPIGFFGSYRVAADRTDPSKLPHLGAWRVNLDRSDPSFRQAGRFKETGTLIFTAENGGLKQEVFLYWPPTKVDYKNIMTDDAREFWFKLDGKNIYPNPQGPNGLGQTVAMWLVDRNTMYRERATKGVVDERVMYRVSPDGKTLTWTRFDNIAQDSSHQVWEKIPMPTR